MNDQAVRKAQTEAAVWFTRLSRRSITTDHLREFREWKKDVDNARAFARVEEIWRKSGALSAHREIRAVADEALRRSEHRDRLAPPKLPGRGTLSIGLAVIAAVGGLGTWRALESRPTYATGVGEQRLVVLPDGSRVRLNTDTAVRVRFSRGERKLEVARGEAFFDVKHDARRPFVVQADGARIVDLGTRFDVRRRPSDVQVILVEGKLEVSGREPERKITLAPNQQILVKRSGVGAARSVDAGQAASWTSGRLVFRSTSLRDAIDEVNRYAPEKVVLDAPSEMALKPVSGVFNTGDTQAFVSAVTSLFPLRARADVAGAIHLTPAPPPEA